MFLPRVALILAIIGLPFSCRAKVVGFPEAIKLALTHNPLMLASRAQQRAAKGRVKSERGTLWPVLKLQSSVGRSDDPLTVLGYRLAQRNATFADLGLGSYSGAASLNDSPSDLNRPGYLNNFDTGIILTVPLYAGGRKHARLNAARAQEAAAIAAGHSTRTQLIYDVLRSYDGVAAARQLLDATRMARTAAASDLRIAESLYKKGVVIKSDVLTAQANLDERDTAVEAALAAEADILDDFRNAVGAGTNDFLEPGTPVTVPLPSLDLHALQKAALRTNPQIQKLREAAVNKRANRRAAEASYWPRIDLVMRHDWNAESPALRAPSNTVMAVMTWELFSFGTRGNNVDAKTNEWEASEAKLDTAKLALRQKVASRYRSIRVTSDRSRSAAAATRQATEAAHLLFLRYKQGLTTINTLLNAQARQNRMLSEAVEATYQAVLARAALLLAIGRLDSVRPVATSLVPDISQKTVSISGHSSGKG